MRIFSVYIYKICQHTQLCARHGGFVKPAVPHRKLT